MTLDLPLSWRRWLGAALLLATPLLGWAQADPPARVAYVSALEGAAQIATDGRSFTPATLNWPVTSGTRLVTAPAARAELQGGWSTLRLSGRTDLGVTELDDDTTQVALTDGTLSVRVRQLQPGERVEIDTPQLAVVASQAGEYRIDVDPRTDTTRLTVHVGHATVYGEAGQSATVGQGQQLQFAGRGLIVTQAAAAQRDGFDQWVATRDALEERSRSARYLPRDLPGYPQLDAHGEWAQDPAYGAVWYPTLTVADWAPYRYGRWIWVEPWGWTWVDDAPWGFAPSHYGRWTQIGPRWAWVPGNFGSRPVYAPALVGFVGGASGGLSWGVSLGSDRPGAAWFPLAPGEYWTPHYHASDRYRRRLNWDEGRERVRPPPDSFHFQRRPGAISVAPVDQFGPGQPGRRPHFGDGSRLPSGALNDGRVVPPPPRAYVPGMQTQAPLPPTRPDPRRNRADFESGATPVPGGVAPRPGDHAQRPPPVVPGAPTLRPAPDHGPREQERDRFLRDSQEPREPAREGAPRRPPAASLPPPPPNDLQLRQRQLQQQQEALVHERQQREPAPPPQRPGPMPHAQPPTPPATAAPARPQVPPQMERAPRQFEQPPAPPPSGQLQREQRASTAAPMREPAAPFMREPREREREPRMQAPREREPRMREPGLRREGDGG